jgi:hypothetical protein
MRNGGDEGSARFTRRGGPVMGGEGRRGEDASAGARGGLSIRARRAGELVSARVVLDRLSRVAALLQPIADGPAGQDTLVSELIADVDEVVTVLLRHVGSGPENVNGDHTGTVERLHHLEARLRGQSPHHLTSSPRAGDLERLTEACRLLRGAALALQPGSLS